MTNFSDIYSFASKFGFECILNDVYTWVRILFLTSITRQLNVKDVLRLPSALR